MSTRFEFKTESWFRNCSTVNNRDLLTRARHRLARRDGRGEKIKNRKYNCASVCCASVSWLSNNHLYYVTACYRLSLSLSLSIYLSSCLCNPRDYLTRDVIKSYEAERRGNGVTWNRVMRNSSSNSYQMFARARLEFIKIPHKVLRTRRKLALLLLPLKWNVRCCYI